MNALEILSSYLGFGALWIASSILLGFIKIKAGDPLVALTGLIICWPYVAYRCIRNIIEGNPNGDIW